MRSLIRTTSRPQARTARRAGLGALFAAAVLLGSTSAQSFPQPNDACESATVLDYRRGESTLDATDAVGDPVHTCTGSAEHKGVWFSYTPRYTGQARFTVTDSQFPPVMSAFSGSCGALTSLACASGVGAPLTFSVTAGTTYLVEMSVVGAGPGGNAYVTTARVDCGNGTVDPGEACDDGNTANGDACTSDCFDATTCGNGVVDPGEECDDANPNTGDGCDSCALPIFADGCGDAREVRRVNSLPPSDFYVEEFYNSTLYTADVSDPAPTCLPGQSEHTAWAKYTPKRDLTATFRAVGGIGSSALRIYSGTCGALTPIACGDEEIDATLNGGETYYLAFATSAASGASTALRIEPNNKCGNRKLEEREECDDGNRSDYDGCFYCLVARCGDYYPRVGIEQCDDGVPVFGASSCTNTCQFNLCGDGVTDANDEECDDGNLIDGDGCDSDCEITEVCGNSTIEGAEDCDDGNTTNGDGCESNCRFPCPLSACNCLGGAARHALVGQKLLAKPGDDATQIAGSACGLQSKVIGEELQETEISGDLLLTRTFSGPSGVAANFVGYRQGGQLVPGAILGGDLITGGGLVKNPGGAIVVGTIDTTGGDPAVAECAQAASDIRAASTSLAALAPTQTLAEIRSTEGEDTEIALGPGLNVINVGRLYAREGDADDDGFRTPSEIVFDFAPATTAVVVNVSEKIDLGPNCRILVQDGQRRRMILNVHSATGRVVLGRDSEVDGVILAPNTTITTSGAEIDNLFTTRTVTLRSTTVSDALDCR